MLEPEFHGVLVKDNKALIRKLYTDFYNGKNPEVIDELFSPGYVHHPHDLPGQTMDFADFKKREVQFLNAFPDLTRAIEDQVAEGDRVATRSILRGTQAADLPDLPSKGKEIEVRSIVIYRIEDGRIAEGWEAIDSLGMMLQLEVIHMVSTLSRAHHERGGLPPRYEWPE